MTTTVTVLQEAIFATTTGTAYTSTDCVTALDKVTATNESTDIATITAQLLSPDGASIATYKKALQPGATWPFALELVGHTLAAGGKLNMICPTANAIRWRASGRKFT